MLTSSTHRIIALGATLAAIGTSPAIGDEAHTYSGTVTIPVWVPADSLPTFTLDLDGHTADSRDVVGSGALTITFAGSAREPDVKTQSCPARAPGSRLTLSDLSAGTVVSATYSPASGTPVTTATTVASDDQARATAAVCGRSR